MQCIAISRPAVHFAPMLEQQIRNRIRNIRLSKKPGKWPLEKVAAKCDPPTRYQTIGKLEQGKMPLTIEWVERLAGALEVDPLELLVGERQSGATPELNEQAANAYAATLAALATGDPSPDEGIVQVVALALRGIVRTIAEDPEAASDPKTARMAANLLNTLYVPSVN